ncbi:hypothetical protein ACQR35_12175 [Pseudarthrobacter sp. J1738]|uniref:hypothetical protein n=1 Tax=Pseudarthrobacter sp. J1738 TaxID=3420446 RepID=UPI003D2A83CD
MLDSAIGEVSTVVRALRSSLDKTANRIYLDTHGRPGRRTYFPLTDDPSKFDSLLESNIPGLPLRAPMVADAIRTCQPFVPEFSCLALLPGLYRVNTHHGFELQDRRPFVEIRDSPEGSEKDERRWAHDEHTWPGVIIERKTWTILGRGDFSDADVDYRQDWYFEQTGNSVFGTLLGLHNATVKAIGAISTARNKPLEAFDFASVSVRVGFA